MRRALLAVTLIAVSLAGCSGGGGKGSDGLEDNVSGLDLEATDSTGVIRGVVIDQAIAPLKDVVVTLTQSGKSTTTNEVGAFGFQDLEPGTYFLTAHKPGYKDIQQSAEVVAGEAEPPIVKVQLVADPSTAASYELFEFHGYLECSAIAGAPGFGGFFMPCEVPLYGSVGNDNSHTTFDISGNASWIHVSMVWDTTQAAGDSLYFNVLDNYDQYNVPVYNGGSSPLTGDANATAIADSKINQQQSFGFEVAVNRQQDTVGAAYHQQFDAYIVVFHGFEPPEGYAFWKDGAPQVPN